MRKNGKDGLKISLIKKIKQPKLPTPESHTNHMFNSRPRTHQLRSEEKRNGKDGLKTLLTKKIKLPILPTLESHMLLPSSKSKEVQKDSPTVLMKNKKKRTSTLRYQSVKSQTTSNSYTSLTQLMKTKSLSKSRIAKVSHSTSDSEKT